MNTPGFGLLSAMVLTVAGCRSANDSARATAAPLIPAGRVNHVVLFDLRSGTDERAFIEDCRSLLAPIPGVTSLFCGTHFETGRDRVVSNYDVAVYVGLDSPESYRGYLVHPNHLALVDRWKSAFESYSVYDIEDTSSAESRR